MIRVKYHATVFTKPLSSPLETVRILREIWDTDLINIQEQVYVLFLNNAGEGIGWRCMNTGKCDGTIFDIKTTMAMATGCLACKVIIAHNHPSGHLEPSPGDIFWTNKLFTALQFVDIVLVDHIILGENGHFSFKENDVPIE